MASESVANMDSAVSSEDGDWLKNFLKGLEKRDIVVDAVGATEEPAVARGAAVEPAPWPAPVGSIPIPMPTPMPMVEIGSVGATTCVFLGPAGAGKTCAVAAMNAACYAEAGVPALALALMSDGQARANAQLFYDGVNWIGLDAAPPPTHDETVYSLELTARKRRAWLGPRLEVQSLRCVDAPGELYFPQPGGTCGRAAFGAAIAAPPIRELASADALVLVVDATRPCLAAIEASLPRLLDRIATSSAGESLPPSRVARILSRLGLVRSSHAPRHTRVNARRVLLLLTKVDVLAAEMAHALVAPDGGASPAAVATAIDPVGLAVEVVGDRMLRRLHRSISADAELAVGICSASGFCGGETFACWSRGRASDERLRAWAPFGIREALQFLALGRCEGTVQRVTEADIEGAEALAVDSHTFQEMT